MNKNRGYTLIELLVAISIGVVILYGVTSTFTGSMQTSATAIRNSQFDQEIRATMSVITRDIKRAGYSSNAVDDVGTGGFTNTFLSTTGEPLRLWSAANVSITRSDTSTVGTCVTYSYDAAPTPDGVLTASTSDYRGFKLLDGIVYKRISATASGANCSDGSWSPLTTNEVVVESLTFKWLDYTNLTDTPVTTTTPIPTGCASVTGGDNTKILERVVNITLRAHSTKDVLLIRTFEEDVKVHNNAYDPCGS